MKNYDKNTESSYLEYLDASDLQAWGMSQKLPVSGFKWIKKSSKFDSSHKRSILEVDVEYSKILFNLHVTYQENFI